MIVHSEGYTIVIHTGKKLFLASADFADVHRCYCIELCLTIRSVLLLGWVNLINSDQECSLFCCKASQSTLLSYAYFNDFLARRISCAGNGLTSVICANILKLYVSKHCYALFQRIKETSVLVFNGCFTCLSLCASYLFLFECRNLNLEHL